MARKASVRYWSSRGTWTDEKGETRHGAFCCTLKGKQYVLAEGPDDSFSGPTYLKATRAFGDLFILVNAGKAGDNNTCRVVLEYYLRHLEQGAAPETLRARLLCLQEFCKTEMADWPVHKLTPFAVNQWLARMRQPRQVEVKGKGQKGHHHQTFRWGDGKVRMAVVSLQAAFNYGAREKLISENPIRGLGQPSVRSRSRDCIVSPEKHEQILNCTRGKFRDAIVCLESTGCRPGELLMATATDWKPDLGALVYHGERRRLEGEGRHKTARKDKDRRIFFTGEALRIMQERVRRYPRGPLWPSRVNPGKCMPVESLGNSFRSLSKRIGLPSLTAYSYRHTYATRWLEAGRSIDDLAALLGNSPGVIRRHYAHLCDNLDRMRSLAESFNAAKAEPPPRVLPFERAAE